MSQTPLRIAVIDENQVRAAILEEGLRLAGLTDITIIRETNSLLRRLVAIDPDVVIIDLENPSRDVLEQMFQVSRMVSRPVAMFVDQSDTSTIERAIEAGVSAYIVDGLRKERVKPILDMTVSRFNAFSKLQRELTEARDALEERKVVERAKGILMKTRNLSEEEAYKLLRQSAMNEKKKLSEIAQSVVTAASLLGG
ncbi:putative transcriptional regulatory protein pdtaR [Hartmannibacter diazotrophicus]|uniref:Putative transcriptional regulatory protein pdtaR n=1 Tax=Hartmannibacter diazotrophicus TaxID=1482074 RepID=A0A2C9D604_9HYPH|nr:ANTAR domain-containing response regulator [Hartmannibacter diazotrophicus]SON55762.1 putative transcriptional regulatory protein pdtaR [Hartmannibacter diazotrophicus]